MINNRVSWSKELSSAKNFMATADLKHWAFGKSVVVDRPYHRHGGAAKRAHYSDGFVNVLALKDGAFKKKVIKAFRIWTSKITLFDIEKKFDKDQRNNKYFELLVHYSQIPDNLLDDAKLSDQNQKEFEEGFTRQIVKESRLRNRNVIQLAKQKHGTKCMICTFDFGKTYGFHGKDFIEMHHLHPLYLGKRKTTVKDLVPVCANCHRMLHKGNTLLSPADLKKIMARQK